MLSNLIERKEKGYKKFLRLLIIYFLEMYPHDYIWQDRTNCILSAKAFEKISYATMATKESGNSEFLRF